MLNFFRPWLASSSQEDNPEPGQEDNPEPGPSNPRTRSPLEKTPTKKKEVIVGRGAKMRKQSVKIIQHVRHFLREVVQSGGNLRCKNINSLTSQATGVSISTVKKVSDINSDSYATPTKEHVNRTKLPFNRIDDFTRDLLRRTVYELFRKGVSPTASMLTRIMREKTAGSDYEFPYGSRTVNRLLHSMGFTYKSLSRKVLRAESNDIIAWRYKYLEEIRKFREQGYNDVYLDETWYDSNKCIMKSWSDDTENCLVTVSNQKGQRIVIVHCGGRYGFVDGALFITHHKMENAPADYHGSMTADIFEDWFENNVLKRLEEPSVIVCDNASYHSRILNPRPNSSWRKELILEFMRKRNIVVPDPVPIIPVLLQLINEYLPAAERRKKYVIDELAASYGHVVLRLPPYHCVLNPIEMVWSEVKMKVASQNLKGSSVNEIRNRLSSAFDSVNVNKWRNYVKKVEQIEDSYRHIQPVFDQGPICIEVDVPTDDSDED